MVVGQSLPRWFLLPIGLALAAAIAWVATHWLDNDRTHRSAVARSDASGASTRDRDEPEAELLVQADAALARGEADDALAHLERHASEFPSSARADDRLLLRVRALCALERGDEAKAMIDDVRRARPEAAVLDRLGDTCIAR
jgi:outer membrane protein assembly factor BamD (BamD/ComL family)